MSRVPTVRVTVEKAGFIYLFIAQFCSELKPLKLQWQQIKKYELAAEIFDLRLEIAYALIQGVEVKGERGNYRTQRVKFNFNHAP